MTFTVANTFSIARQVYVNKPADDSSQDISRKFRFEDRKIVELDEKRFVAFGTLDDDEQTGGGQQSAADQLTTWEDMATEEESWNELDKSLQMLRKETREHRIRQHQQQRQLKMMAKKGPPSNR